MKLENETVWLTQEQMAELFQKSQSTINEHIQNIYKEGELVETKTLRKFGISENSFSKPTNYYNLDIIISVGYGRGRKKGVEKISSNAKIKYPRNKKTKMIIK